MKSWKDVSKEMPPGRVDVIGYSKDCYPREFMAFYRPEDSTWINSYLRASVKVTKWRKRIGGERPRTIYDIERLLLNETRIFTNVAFGLFAVIMIITVCVLIVIFIYD